MKYLPTVLFINYDEKVGFNITILLRNENGIVPFVIEKTNFINYYPNLAKKLIDGKVLYVNYDYGYVGDFQSKGPYCEQEVFMSEYEANNIDFNELIINLNQNIKNGKKMSRELVKIGDYYK